MEGLFRHISEPHSRAASVGLGWGLKIFPSNLSHRGDADVAPLGLGLGLHPLG